METTPWPYSKPGPNPQSYGWGNRAKEKNPNSSPSSGKFHSGSSLCALVFLLVEGAMQPEEEVVPKEMPLSSSSFQFILCGWQLVFSCPAFCLYRYNISHLEVVLLLESMSEMNWLAFPAPQSLPPPSPLST